MLIDRQNQFSDAQSGTLTASGFTSFLAKDLAAFRAYTSGYAVQ